ncbi:hypothetical protein [Bradyrhizobium murdochi]|uniref:hypothetical protein n=1 Tax=Bradyrhizobium murdochi TaxID=1038859 RepID=UPI00040A461D|nr:hypothetical protein [Bradyrhizobium murdochi]
MGLSSIASWHQDWLSRAATNNDVIDGGAGNDLITAGAGDDIIEGGEGVDTANFSGNVRDYDISTVDDQLVVNDLRRRPRRYRSSHTSCIPAVRR